MRSEKGAKSKNEPMAKIELELEKKIIDQIQVMEDFTKIPKSELVCTALKRFISAHKDYFPENYRS